MSDLFAALDLGSNSFHMLLAHRAGGTFETVERLQEKVQLLRGFRGGRLHADAMARGEACLARFAQRLADVPRAQIRIAGTHALREADNREEFAAAAQRIFGVPLEVISGSDEARLINLGVAHQIPAAPGDGRLVVDVGGGSTELAWSDAAEPLHEPRRVASFKVGCVSLTEAHFQSGVAQPQAYLAARARALQALDGLTPVAAGCEVIGTSGTVESVHSVLAANGWDGECITADGLAMLTDAIVDGRWLVEAGLPGLQPERVDIFAAGLAVVDALFQRLGLRTMRFVDVSLQDGLLYRDVTPPDRGEDLRARTVARLQQRFAVDTAQAARVRRTALALFDGTAAWWPRDEGWRALLGWAAELHEIGTVVASRHYHRHGAYLLQNSDMRAFSPQQQFQLALLVRGHRRAFPGLSFRAYDDATRRCLVRLLSLLRIAVILHRGHSDAHAPPVAASIGADQEGLNLDLGAPWLAAHPLSARELEVEAGQLDAAGIRLRVR
ncbi:MAG: Ppx/GppA phosphatase family protein [Gammaproteobacteria bacterium]|nr:Ppx/GppA phosphatase family protein [Gammaproteobacteria bacterium]